MTQSYYVQSPNDLYKNPEYRYIFTELQIFKRRFCHRSRWQKKSFASKSRDKPLWYPDHNEPIGIIIAADKHEFLVKYATGGLSNKIFVSKYQLYLPDQKVLEKKVKEIIESE
jgi:hypothetical protein